MHGFPIARKLLSQPSVSHTNVVFVTLLYWVVSKLSVDLTSRFLRQWLVCEAFVS